MISFPKLYEGIQDLLALGWNEGKEQDGDLIRRKPEGVPEGGSQKGSNAKYKDLGKRNHHV